MMGTQNFILTPSVYSRHVAGWGESPPEFLPPGKSESPRKSVLAIFHSWIQISHILLFTVVAVSDWRSIIQSEPIKYLMERLARLHAYLLRDVEPQDQDHDTDVSFISKTTSVRSA